MKTFTEYDLAKLRPGKLYVLPSGAVCKLIKVDWVHGKVFIYRYDIKSNETLDVEIAPRILTPAWKIGEVAAMLQRSPDTMRKYERAGLIDSPNRHKIGNQNLRIYTLKDINKLITFFENRAPVGRPSKTNESFGVNKTEVRRRLKSRFEEIKSKI